VRSSNANQHIRNGKFGQLSVDEYVDLRRNVWRKTYSRRTTADCVLHLLDHASRLGEAIRKNNANLILMEIAGTANWLFGLVAKLNDSKNGWESNLNISTPLSLIIWFKYPGICPHCFQIAYNRASSGRKTVEDILQGKKTCQYCLTNYPRTENRPDDHLCRKELRNYAQQTLALVPKTLGEMEKMFHRIYMANVSLSTTESIGFHVLEEAGEVGRALIDIYTLRQGDNPEVKQHLLCDEIAEVFAWLCSLTLKVRQQVETVDEYGERLLVQTLPGARERLSESVGLEQILWAAYRDPQSGRYRCPTCRQETCRCRQAFLWDPYHRIFLETMRPDANNTETDLEQGRWKISDANKNFQLAASMIRSTERKGMAIALIDSEDDWSHSDPQFKYLHPASIEATKVGKDITRIFVVKDSRLHANGTHLYEVMKQEHDAGVKVYYGTYEQARKAGLHHVRDIAIWDDYTISVAFGKQRNFEMSEIHEGDKETKKRHTEILGIFTRKFTRFGDP